MGNIPNESQPDLVHSPVSFGDMASVIELVKLSGGSSL
jgi:hypothetical protein